MTFLRTWLCSEARESLEGREIRLSELAFSDHVGDLDALQNVPNEARYSV